MQAGLVSITFRELDPGAIILLCVEAGLSSIEWGGDVHVPHGNIDRARETGLATREHGLRVCSYGSYYRLGRSEGEGLAFGNVLETAVALGAPTVRVWAGDRGSGVADEAYRNVVAGETRRISHLAAEAGLRIGFEFHSNTLTDTAASARDLLDAINDPNVFLIWQPPVKLDTQECLDGLSLLVDKVCHVHAFHWWPDSKHRLPLAKGADRWREYLARLGQRDIPGDVLLEFLPDNNPDLLKREAETLRELLSGQFPISS